MSLGGFVGGQLANVVEWEQYDERQLFWKWNNSEIKKGSRLIIRPGQDAIFLSNGAVEGVFRDEGSFDIESEIIPFLSTLKGFKFGFNSGMRAEVIFINTKEITEKWGTKNAIMIPAQGLPGGMPIRAFGTFGCKISDYKVLIEKIAGVRSSYSIDDVKERVISKLDQLLMKWIVTEGKDMFNLQAYAGDIGAGIAGDLNAEMNKIGLEITDFSISSVSYPEEIQKMAEKVAAQSMIGGNIGMYQQVAMADALAQGGDSAVGSTAASMAGLGVGMQMSQQMMNQMGMGAPMQQGYPQAPQGYPQAPQNAADPVQGAAGTVNFCPNCGTKTEGAKFCPNCGTKLG